MSKDERWDRGLSVAADDGALTGHAGAVLLRKLADQCGLTAALGAVRGSAGPSSTPRKSSQGTARSSPDTAAGLGMPAYRDIAGRLTAGPARP